MSDPKIPRIVARKSADLLSDQLRDMILKGEYAAGDMLPPERDLVLKSGLSRGSVREALRILQTEGLVEISLGRNGGARVTSPKASMLARSVELFVRTNSVGLSSLLEARAAVEPMLARLAAQNHTAGELAEIEALHADFVAARDDVQRYRRINYRWHSAISQASRNAPLMALMEAVLNTAHEATSYMKVTVHTEYRLQAIAAHEAVMVALRARDGDAAAAAMEGHLTGYASFAQKHE